MKRTREEALQTREDLLKAALKLFGQKGYNATRLEDIAKEANVTRGALYWHFKGKDEIFLELIKEHAFHYFKMAQDVAHTNLPPLEKMRWLMKNVLFHVETNEEIRNGVQLEYERITATPLLEKFRTAFLEMERSNHDLVHGIIEAGQKDGSIRSDQTAEGIMAYISIIIAGAIMSNRLRNQVSTNIFSVDIEVLSHLAIDAIRNHETKQA